MIWVEFLVVLALNVVAVYLQMLLFMIPLREILRSCITCHYTVNSMTVFHALCDKYSPWRYYYPTLYTIRLQYNYIPPSKDFGDVLASW
uniref:Uncharacterized protein n=1 Tax=Anguilla anguilla TaxID=7936 RepID=A0A0E9X1Y9_ANGAN